MVFGFIFWGRGEVRKGTDGKNIVFQERAVAESLVDLLHRASGNDISIGIFRAGMHHGGLERLCFFLFISCLRDAFAAQYVS